MKKVVSFIAFLFLCLSAVAQGTLLPSAKVDLNNKKETYIYDERGNILEQHTFKLTDSKWVESSYRINTYYADNSLESYATYYYNNSGQLVLNQKFSYKYDSKGRIIEEIRYRSGGNTFIYSSKYVSVYNEDGNLTSCVRYSYSSSNENWVKEFTDSYWYTEGKLSKSVDERYITDYSYDTKGRLIEEIQQYRTGGNYNYKQTFSYYDTDSLQTEMYYTYQNNKFVENSKTEFTYDIAARTTTFKTYYWSGNNWEGCYGEIKTWNAQGQVTYEAYMANNDFAIQCSSNYQYNSKGQLVSEVSTDGKNEYEYDSFGNMITSTYSKYSDDAYVPVSKYVKVVDSYNNVDSFTEYKWNAESKEWEVNTAQGQNSYYYLYDGYRLDDDPRFAVTVDNVTTEYMGVSAFTAAQKASKATVKLLADTNDDNIGVRLTEGNITFDLNGHTFQHHIYVNKATLTIEDSSADKTGLIQTTLRYGDSEENESLVLAAGTLNINQAVIKGEYPICVYGGSLNVYAGDFTDESAEDAIYIQDGVATLYGGKFKSLNIDGGKIIIASGYVYKTSDASTDLRGVVDDSFQTGYYGEVIVDPTPTAISNIKADNHKTIKTFENGQVIIIRDCEKYDLAGRKL